MTNDEIGQVREVRSAGQTSEKKTGIRSRKKRQTYSSAGHEKQVRCQKTKQHRSHRDATPGQMIG